MYTVYVHQISAGLSQCQQYQNQNQNQNPLLLQVNNSIFHKTRSRRIKVTPTRSQYHPNQQKITLYAPKPNKCLLHSSPWSPGFKQGLSPARARRSERSKPTEHDEEVDEEAQKAMEEESRREDWVERGWAPWEAILSLQADFAIKSLNETSDDMEGLKTQETIEAFNRVTPKRRKEENSGTDKKERNFLKNHVLPEQRRVKIGDEEYELVPRTSQWGEPEPIETVWNSPLVFTLIPPRDWPPPGWKVDPQELAFIREAHKLDSVRVDPEALERPSDPSKASFPRFEMFIKQYNEWVSANKERLDKEALEVDPHYHPGRRRTGSKYVEGMYELPFVYPGQIYGGHVTSVHLYLGAFVFIGCVYDGWVPIKGNDWYWVRHHIKVGMHVQVEVVAKRDPYRFRFPIELRFVNPNIDHLIFNKFEYPPIFGRDDTNYDELARETGRPFLPRRRPKVEPQDQPMPEYHPYSKKIGQIHVSEQAILDEEEKDPNEEEVEDESFEETGKELDTDNKVYDSDNDGFWIEAEYEELELPKLILTTDEKDLDMDAAHAERKIINKLKKEAKAKGKTFVMPKLLREKQMDELDAMHMCRLMEQREALTRDISCRLELGLPIEEPGRYADDELWLDEYDPTNPRYRNDYWGDPNNLRKEEVKVKKTPIRRTSNVPVGSPDGDTLTKSPSTDVEDVSGNSVPKNIRTSREENHGNDKNDNFVKGNVITNRGNKPLVNGTESFGMGDVPGMFDDQDKWNDNQEDGDAAASDTEDV